MTIRIDDHVLAWLRQQVNAAGGGDYRFLADMKNPRDLGTGGKITWTRDELHQRHPAKKKGPTE